MNLYIKNLEPHINNDALFQLFKKFGRIVSARVMSNPATGQSKGYGFVSYDKAEEAAAALQEMNGKVPPHGVKPLIVAYHEPKKPRQEKQGQNRAGMASASNFSSSGGIRTPSVPVSRPMPEYINNHAPVSSFDPNVAFTTHAYDINAQPARTNSKLLLTRVQYIHGRLMGNYFTRTRTNEWPRNRQRGSNCNQHEAKTPITPTFSTSKGK